MFEGPRISCLSIPGFTNLRILHDRLTAGMPGARDEMARSLLTLVRPRFRRQSGRTDDAMVEECIEDAVLEYLDAPKAYDSSAGSLDGYIAAAARSKLIERQRGEQRRLRREAAWRRADVQRAWMRLRLRMLKEHQLLYVGAPGVPGFRRFR